MWEWWFMPQQLVTDWWLQYGDLVVRAATALAVAFVLHWVTMFILRRVTARSHWKIDDQIVCAICRPSRWLALLFALLTIPITGDELPPGTVTTARHILSLLVVFFLVRLGLRLTTVIDSFIKAHHPLNVADNYMARRVHTQTTVLRRTANLFIVFVGVSAAVMTFPRVRELGTGLLASAGIVGVIVGLALRPILENLLAGLQIALTQPIKIEDSVNFQGEYGNIEEINTTYVVVRLWDDRRLIVPLSKFIQEPFQNWTRRTARLLGTLILYADYQLPVQTLREEFESIVHKSPNWDGRVAKLEVTDASENAMQLRCLVSADTPGKSWDLRVEVREKLIAFMHRQFPECLPRMRVSFVRSQRPGAANGDGRTKPADLQWTGSQR